MLIRPMHESELDLVATRMRETLLEVVGEELYSLEWLRQRVLWHVQHGQVLVAEDSGHTIVREDPPGTGLFSTTYVAPEQRRRGIASALLQAGEAWMRARSCTEAVTYTAESNLKLQHLYARHGYAITERREGFVKLWKALSSEGS